MAIVNESFIKYLFLLYHQSDYKTLSKFRKMREQRPHYFSVHVERILSNHLQGLPDAERYARLLVAMGFAFYPHTKAFGNMGNTYRVVKRHYRSGTSIERRFENLIDADEKLALFDRMLAWIMLCKTRKAPINWFQLIDDLNRWGEQGKPIQRAWSTSAFANLPRNENVANGGKLYSIDNKS